MAADNDQNAMTAEETAQMEEMKNDAGTGIEAEPVKEVAGTPAKTTTEAPAEADVKKAEAEKADAEKSKTVSHGAFHEEREKRKKLEGELKTEREERIKLEARTNLILEKLIPKPEEPKPDVIPDFDIDPAGWIAATMKASGKTLDTVQAELAEIKKDKTANAERSKQNDAVKVIIDYAVAEENKFKAITPDFDEASAFLIKSRTEELEDMNYSAEQINQVINTERLSIAMKAKEDGKNPAEVVYKIAKRRGFTAKVIEDPNKVSAEKAAADKLAAEKSAERVSNIDKGQKISSSLSDVGGKAEVPLTAARLLEMSEADFARVVNTPAGRAAMGA